MTPIFSENAPKAIGPYAHAMRTGNLLYLSGQTPLNPETMELVGDNIDEQTERVFKNLELVLKDAGLSRQNVVKVNVYLTTMANFEGMNEAYANFFKEHKPSRTTVAVLALPMDALVEIECMAEYP